ncbi:coatomer alpha subunit, putative [Entamoeba histolytica HM-1:IMSS-B]|uniref:Coatomer alpha subunit, putative n=6 Tax=Entamoeba histolytica TaxID=5759 RepID=A0A8U0WPY0_ENTH1|nr:coatomer alpha subunit, putative [Entamoeba histolytica HM-1:IMSS]EMH74301.1 coatomer alpha subunit, putative [Entamoeba histolytica HM-1:IMSS-B]EMS12080.1 coatomer subunit beta'-3, putative [Entamoeba histolytica HM-3:IMSS]ENY60187.1 coatomer subunit beta'-3, putative [Entamoeba histolytica HM-1:IMSS-A]BAE94778.1 alpha1-COP [Entamoeba histolytica]EAL43196.1 coatomer alpha subunit, putative [Entamoeba histolytica HM-1:IMSS]|eukprot:XP_648580.1 coatomer alpha subunit, putative [Entamoeba histolytica HM-1:IMSS]
MSLRVNPSFETRTARVKGISFHPTRSWVLASLHNGKIQLWDMRTRTLLHVYEGHKGPVRSVQFHPDRPIFVSGGDDTMIIVWSYTSHRETCRLTGHMDYVRTVQFHPTEPWIISSSDDRTIRIWNWMSRQCILILPGHEHYVMSAFFHPKANIPLVVSASLDQTVRVWDISGLKERGEGVVKFLIDGHQLGVNWAVFHPNQQYIATASDDKTVRLWKYNDTRVWEVCCLRGHSSIVSCVQFMPHCDVLISNSEDRTVKLWDITKRTLISSYRRERDRFWNIGIHPNGNVIGCGHDSGMIIFKLNEQRIPIIKTDDRLYYLCRGAIRVFEFAGKKDSGLINLPKRSNAGINEYIGNLVIDENRKYLIVCYPKQNSHDLYNISNGKESTGIPVKGGYCVRLKQGYAAFDKGASTISIRKYDGSVIRSITLTERPERMVKGPYLGSVVFGTKEEAIIFDIESQKVIKVVKMKALKRVVSGGAYGEYCGLIGKRQVVILNNKMEVVCKNNEVAKVKSGVFFGETMFYTTTSHLKYILPNGEGGVIKQLESVMYLADARPPKMYLVNREGQLKLLTINPNEYLFKLNVFSKDYSTLVSMVEQRDVIGQYVVGYLRNKGLPEIALQCVRDPQIRADLSLKCLDLESAFDACKQLDSPLMWKSLGNAAMISGHQEYADKAYQKTQDATRASYLYVSCGAMEKLDKIMKVTEKWGDFDAHFTCSTLSGNKVQIVKSLFDAGQMKLSYLAAKKHGLEELAEKIALEIKNQGNQLPTIPQNNKPIPFACQPTNHLLVIKSWPTVV